MSEMQERFVFIEFIDCQQITQITLRKSYRWDVRGIMFKASTH